MKNLYEVKISTPGEIGETYSLYVVAETDATALGAAMEKMKSLGWKFTGYAKALTLLGSEEEFFAKLLVVA